jgi:type 1 glutamine amidotransferase
MLLAVAALASVLSPAAERAEKLKVLVVTGGHGFAREPFFQMFRDNPAITFTPAEHSRTNATVYERADLLDYDVVVLYDMPKTITDAQKARFLSLFDKGVGLVVLHHALVSYQHWPGYERIIGGRYPEEDGKSGVVTEQVGYEHDVDVPVVIVARDHPVTAGLKDFMLHDEIYWGYRVGADVTALVSTMHPKSGKPLAWSRTENKSRVVFIQSGHGPEAFTNANYRQLLAQSIRWAANKPATAAQGFDRWRFYRGLNMDTSPAGANVTGDVRNFPLAVALNATDFDFSQTQLEGADIRFSTQAHGTPLAHAIEHWDRAGKTALVWVKVTLVGGNTSSQAIFMHWGNANAASAGDSATVFDAADGFVGVWHLDEDGNTNAGTYKDATASAADGTGVNLTAGSRVDARIGKGLALDHARNQWVKIEGDKRNLFDLTNRLTFSIWARVRSYSNKGNPAKRALPGYETMFAKGDNSWRLQKFGTRGWHQPPAELIEICVEQRQPRADLTVVGRSDMVTNQWFHFTGVHEHPQARLYVNGVLDKVETFDTAWMSGDHPVGIGNQSQFPQQGRGWDGILDEARVLDVVKDEHWIKLDYESQKEGQRFLTFGKTGQRF